MVTIPFDNSVQLFPKNYRDKITALQKRLDTSDSNDFGLQKSTSNLFRHRAAKSGNGFNLSHFNSYIQINRQEGWADFEGMTTYENCVAALIPKGFMPTVVPELKTITIGGAVTGIGIESSSFKFGLVHETILELDILTPAGQIITATPHNQYQDLFYAFPNSYGTLGYALRVRVKIIPIKPYIHLQHHSYNQSQEFLEAMENFCGQKDQLDFVEGVVFSKNQYVITTGAFCDAAPYANDYSFMNIYYPSLLSRNEDYLSAKDYIWRWDTDWFWCSKHFLAQVPWIRKLYGRDRLRSTTYWKIRSKASKLGITKALDKITGRKEAIIQDVEIPFANSKAYLDFFLDNIQILPVWVCPTRQLDSKKKYSLYPMDPNSLYLNFGFWDVVPTNKEAGYYNRLIENKVRELKGKKSLYSDSYYSETEFWELYNGDVYNELKAKYDPKGRQPSLYQKCVRGA